MTKYYIYYEGNLEIEAEDDIDEEELFELATDIIYGDARTRLDNDCSIVNMEIVDKEKDYDN